MKRPLLLIGTLSLVYIAHTYVDFSALLKRTPSVDHAASLNTEYFERCLPEESVHKPVWECYEVEVTSSIGEHEPVWITHEDGDRHRTLTFRDNARTWFRFAPTKQGTWQFSTGGQITITDERPEYAQGFSAGRDKKWVRTATGRAYVPQWVMYDAPDLDAGIREFIDGHGFTGFHITNLRDFLKNPGYFEAVVLKTYRAGGTTHFWVWGDAQRNQTPDTYGQDVRRLYLELAARLSPIPGWSVGYGFDLHEWASASEVEQFRATLNRHSSYRHLVGARGEKNRYQALSEDLDYSSWEWHRPTYQDYVQHLEHSRAGKPAFSEDRFRIREPSNYPEKDYTEALTLTGLWDSLLAGGVANIWGKKDVDSEYSLPYAINHKIKTYRRFVDNYFHLALEVSKPIAPGLHCLKGDYTICKTPSTAALVFERQDAWRKIVAVDIHQPYHELEYAAPSSGTLELPRQSEWALVVY